MTQDVASELLTITVTEAEKKKLRIAAAMQGTSMREIVRSWIREIPAINERKMIDGRQD